MEAVVQCLMPLCWSCLSGNMVKSEWKLLPSVQTLVPLCWLGFTGLSGNIAESKWKLLSSVYCHCSGQDLLYSPEVPSL